MISSAVHSVRRKQNKRNKIMRKLLILTSAIAMVCSAQAASYLWGLAGGEIITPTGSYDDGDYLEGGTAFLFLGTVTASANAFDMSSATYIASSQMDDTTYTYGSMDESSLASSSDVASTAAGQAFSIILIEKERETRGAMTFWRGCASERLRFFCPRPSRSRRKSRRKHR